jgi:hypothetical protein
VIRTNSRLDNVNGQNRCKRVSEAQPHPLNMRRGLRRSFVKSLDGTKC